MNNNLSKRASITVSAAATLALAVNSAHAGTIDHSLIPIGSIQEVAAFSGPGPSGIVVTPEGRTFVGFSRHADDHAGMTLGGLVNGKLVPYPSADVSLPSELSDAKRLVSVHGMTLDKCGRL